MLVLVLAVLASLSLLVLGLSHQVRLRLKMSRMQTDELRAHYLALGGIQRALAAIAQDEDSDVDHCGEPWHLIGNAAGEELLPLLEESAGEIEAAVAELHLSYAVSDEEGRLNLNTTSPAIWAELPGVDEQLVFSIVDWQDEDQISTRGGAESKEYQYRSPPYRAKDRSIATIWELCLISGVSWPRFLGEDVNGNTMLDAGEDDGLATWPADNADGKLDAGLMDYFTARGQGKININTAGAAVLAVLPDIGEATAEAIVAHRNGPDGQPFTADDKHFENVAELKSISGVTEYQADLLAEYCAVKSLNFRVTVEARVRRGGRPYRLQAMVKRDDDGPKLVWVRYIDS